MKLKHLSLLCLCLLVLCAGFTAEAASEAPDLSNVANPPPDFGNAYTIPETTVPEPPSALMDYLDVGVLVLALALAAWFSLKTRSRRALFVLSILSLIYFGFYRKGCVCAVGSVQNVVLTFFDQTYSAAPVVLLFFALPLLFTLFFGRGFCASVCPLGAVQEIVLLRPLRLPVWLQKALGLLAYIYLGAAILYAATGSAFLICRYDPFVSFFRYSGSLNLMVLGFAFLFMSIFIGRPYCRFLCPYGVLLNWFSKLSKWRVTVTPAECVNCRLCEDACPFGAIQPSTLKEQPVSRKSGKPRLALLCLLLPLLIVLGGWLGDMLGIPLARGNPTVQLAERITLEKEGLVEGTTDASDAFRDSGKKETVLIKEAQAVQGDFRLGALLLGGFLGLILGLKLIALSVRRARPDYEPDKGGCFACGRCYQYCPVEKDRIKQKGESTTHG